MSKTIEEKIAVMQAFVDGKDIEFYPCDGVWGEVNSPEFNWTRYDYRIRIKPEKPEWMPQWGEAVWVRYSENDGWMEGCFNESIDGGFWVMVKGSVKCEEFPSWNIIKRPQPIFMRKDESKSGLNGLGFGIMNNIDGEHFAYHHEFTAPVLFVKVDEE